MIFCRCQTSAIVIKKGPHIIKPYQNLEKFAQLTLFKSKTFRILMTISSNLFIRSWHKVIHRKHYKDLQTITKVIIHKLRGEQFLFYFIDGPISTKTTKVQDKFEFLQYLGYKLCHGNDFANSVPYPDFSNCVNSTFREIKVSLGG